VRFRACLKLKGYYIMTTIIGSDFDVITSDQQFPLGTRSTSRAGKEYVYVQMDATGCSAGDAIVISEAFVGDQATTTNTAPAAGQGLPVGVAEVAFTASYYGWLLIYGATSALSVGPACVEHTNLNSTGVAGRLDDDATAGAEVIEGLTSTGARVGNFAPAFAAFPRVGRTL
jgi:hypothetical protein